MTYTPPDEPSVLDYLKSKLTPWRGAPLQIPGEEIEQDLERGPVAQVVETETESIPPSMRVVWPWRSILAFGLALAAQLTLQPRPDRSWTAGVVLYLLAFSWLVWAIWRGEWVVAPLPEDERRPDPLSIRISALLVGIPAALVAYVAFGGNKFTFLNFLFWGVALIFLIRAFWLGNTQIGLWLERLRAFLVRPRWNLSISRDALLLMALAAFVLFFRTYQLDQVPPEMNSDHAEKLLDVADVLSGETRIFFPRNTGREAIQFYLTAGVAILFGTGVSFASLKIGTALAGLLTLSYIYLLGKEVADRRVGLLAMALAGIAYWPNVISRFALRFTLYPLFVAATLYYLIRGLRRSSRNDFILSGLALGIGLHGYTPIRILPFVVVIAVGLYLIHRQSVGVRKLTLMRLGLLALMTLIVFLPLLRFALENPDLFAYRTFTRVGTLERPLPGPAGQIFLGNLWNAMTMFAWDNGEVWTVSVPHIPALDIVSAVLFYLGMVVLMVRYICRRNWLDLFLVLSVPLLMMPSILSLAFPSENPILSRTSGAIVPVFIICGITLKGLLSSIKSSLSSPWGSRLAWVAGILLFAWSSILNYDLVFNQYRKVFELSSWNTSEVGSVIRNFADSVGDADSAWVMGYPHWMDTRLVGINAGYPTKDYAMFVEQLSSTLDNTRMKLFVINPQDTGAVDALQELYPQGVLWRYTSQVETKDFLQYLVPPQD